MHPILIIHLHNLNSFFIGSLQYSDKSYEFLIILFHYQLNSKKSNLNHHKNFNKVENNLFELN